MELLYCCQVNQRSTKTTIKVSKFSSWNSQKENVVVGVPETHDGLCYGYMEPVSLENWTYFLGIFHQVTKTWLSFTLRSNHFMSNFSNRIPLFGKTEKQFNTHSIVHLTAKH